MTEKTLALPESLVQQILDHLKTQPYEQVFQLIAGIMRVVQSQQLSPDDQPTEPNVSPGDS